MKIKLIVVGKTNATYLQEGEIEYQKRLQHYIKFEELVVGDVKNARNLTQQELQKKEGALILSKIENIDFVILLDDKGRKFSSVEFSKFLNEKNIRSTKSLVFVVGGAFGFSDEVYQRANTKMSLSKMTFSHQMVRLIFKEQLYRAFTIIKGEKYHHE